MLFNVVVLACSCEVVCRAAGCISLLSCYIVRVESCTMPLDVLALSIVMERQTDKSR